MYFKVFYQWLRHPLSFLYRVMRRFHTNQGTLLAGAIAYNALLSLIPLVILLLVALSQFVSQSDLLNVLHHSLEQVMPTKSDIILWQVQLFMEHRRLLGWTMVVTLFGFSSAAFAVLQNAMKVIFAHREKIHNRGWITTLIMPYIYVLLLGFGILSITLMNGVLQTWGSYEIHILKWEWSPNEAMVNLMEIIGQLSQVLGLTLVYMLMPAGRLPWQHALIGAITALLLWETVSYGLAWYFANLSAVNAIYGSLAGVIIVLMTLYAISLIILFGAQVIAEYERELPEFSQKHLETEATN